MQAYDGSVPKVVIGFDGRRQSRQFAEDTSAVLTGLGLEVFIFMDPVPTPLCAYALTQKKAAAAVMVTASHNPPDDNGYKVYWGNGAQIIPPDLMPKSLRPLPKHLLVSEMTRFTPPQAQTRGIRHWIDDSLAHAYLEEVSRRSFYPDTRAASSLRIVYTAMHVALGAGWSNDY